MRLTCPNCSARYEVADSMLPPEGRDVQCSNCATTWFQPGRRTDPATSASMAPPPIAVVRPQRPVAQTTPPEPAAAPKPAPEVAAEAAPPAPTPASPEVAPTRRTLDPDLRSILQEEAEREARLRRAEADPVETQSEMPLDQDPIEVRRARRRAELDAAPDAFAADKDAEALAHAPRPDAPSARDLFPDIDEINSTLRDTGDRSFRDPDASDIDTLDTLPRRRRGARIGFFGVIAVAALAAALYANAARVVTAVPAAAPAVAVFVEKVDLGRVWLDDLVRRLAEGTTPQE